jgi:hypothetical protein
MTDFTIWKNINNAFSMYVPKEFLELTPETSFIYTAFPIDDTITMAVEAGYPHTTPPATAPFVLGQPEISIQASDILSVGPVPHNYPIAAETRTIRKGGVGISVEGSGGTWVGTETTGGSVTGRYKNWYPFTVDLAQSTAIVSALFRLTVKYSQGNCDLKIGVDNRGISPTPTTYDELNLITVTPSYLTATGVGNVVGTTYDFNITAAVQECLNLATWVVSSTMGIIVDGLTTTTGARYMATFNDGTYLVPQLDITTAT